MKKHLLFALLLFVSLAAKAQDTIIKRNGDKLVVKLIEVNVNDVKYKLLDYLEGPMFTISKQDIKEIGYANGKKESFESYVPPSVTHQEYVPQDLTIQTSGKYFYYKDKKIRERDMLAVTQKLNDKKINLMVKTVERDRFIQNMTTDASIACGVVGMYMYVVNRAPQRSRRGPPQSQSATQLQKQKDGEYLMLAGIACETVSICYIFNRRNHDRILVNAFNSAITIR